MTRTFKKAHVWVNDTVRGTLFVDVAETSEGCLVRTTIHPDWPTGHSCNGDWQESGDSFAEECLYWLSEGYEEI